MYDIMRNPNNDLEGYGDWSDDEYFEFFNERNFKHYNADLDECKKWCDYCVKNNMRCLNFNDDYIVSGWFTLWFKQSKAYKKFQELTENLSWNKELDHPFITCCNLIGNYPQYFVVTSPYHDIDDTWFKDYEYNVVLFNPLFIDYSGFINPQRDFATPNINSTPKNYGLTKASGYTLECLQDFMMKYEVFSHTMNFKPFEIVKDDYY